MNVQYRIVETIEKGDEIVWAFEEDGMWENSKNCIQMESRGQEETEKA